jgi:hypothetical protein
MTKIPINYSNTVIYKIVCNDLAITDVYVGSTTSFVKRKYLHKSDCNNVKREQYNEKKYIIIRANGGWNNWSMIEIEKFPCNDNNEARARERYWYEVLQSNMNSIRPFLEKDERIENKKTYLKNYKELNKSIISENFKKYYELNKNRYQEKINCLCGGSYSYASKYNHIKTKKHQCYLAQIKEPNI